MGSDAQGAGRALALRAETRDASKT